MIVSFLIGSHIRLGTLSPPEKIYMDSVLGQSRELLADFRYPEALKLWQEAKEHLGQQTDVMLNLASCQFFNGQYAEAAAQVFMSGQFEKAKRLISHLIDHAPAKDRHVLIYALSSTLTQLQQWQEAEQLLRELTRTYPESDQYWLLLAGVFMEQARHRKALECYRRSGQAGLKDYCGGENHIVQIVSARELCEIKGFEYHQIFPPATAELRDRQTRYSLPEAYVFKAKDAVLVPCNYSLVFDWKYLVYDGLDTNSRQSMTMLPHFHVHSCDDRVLLDMPGPSETIADEVFLFGGGPNFSHCINDWCSKFFIWSEFKGKKDLPILISKAVSSSIIDWLEYLGIDKHRFVWLEPGTAYRLENVWVPSLSHRFQWISPQYLKYIRRQIKTLSRPAPPTRRLYFSRRNASVRQLVNETELLDTLRPRHFEIVFAETLSMKEQIQLLAEAEVLVMPIGGASAASLFLPDGALMIELQSANIPLQQYELISALQGTRYHAVKGPVRGPDAHSLFDNAFEVSVAQVLSILDREGIK